MNNSNKITGLVKSIGGGDDIYKLQSFVAMIILGYFGIKIVLAGFFQFYPDKYYYRTVDIETTDPTDKSNITKKIALNAFMPGIWNNEMTDFIVAIVLTGITYIFTQAPQRRMFEKGGKVDTYLIVGYILGLTFPLFYKTFKDKCKFTVSESCTNHNTGIILTSIVLLVVLYLINSKYPDETKSNYFIYMMGIILLIVGLYYTRKLRRTYLRVNYYKNKDGQCIGGENGFLFSSGEQLLITPAFAAWVLLFFFVIEPPEGNIRNILYLLYGLLLGILISSLSYYGIDYFLVKVPEKKCATVEECKLKDMGKPPQDVKTSTSGEIISVSSEEEEGIIIKKKSSKFMNILKMILIVFIIIMFGYFVMYSKKK
jgi:hypothetical protein